jgi:hypothetical protein
LREYSGEFYRRIDLGDLLALPTPSWDLRLHRGLVNTRQQHSLLGYHSPAECKTLAQRNADHKLAGMINPTNLSAQPKGASTPPMEVSQAIHAAMPLLVLRRREAWLRQSECAQVSRNAWSHSEAVRYPNAAAERTS